MSALLRLAMWRLARVALVYTETERQRALYEIGSRDIDVIVAPNSLYRMAQMGAGKADDPRGFLYVGRLSADKDPLLVLEAAAEVAPLLGRDARLLVVGDGPLRGTMEAHAERLEGVEVQFLGHIGDRERLREVYSQVLAAVSPGYVGLSIIQSLSFGIPLIYPMYAYHAPEIEAAIEGETAVAFPQRSSASLGSVLLEVSRNRTRWIASRTALVEWTRNRYSAEAMADGIVTAVSRCLARQRC